MQDHPVDFQSMDMGTELASLQLEIDFDEDNILDGVTTPSRSPSPHIGLNEANLAPVPDFGDGQNNLSLDQQVANDRGASATPVVSIAALNAPNVVTQSRELPWDGVRSTLSSSAVGSVPSIQGGELAQVIYPSYNSHYDHLLLPQTPPAAPIESITNNQLIPENVATNNDLSAVFNWQPSLHPSILHENPVQVGQGVFGSGNLSLAPQTRLNPTWPQYNQIPLANSYSPNYMNWDRSNSYWPESYSYGEPNFLPTPSNSFGHPPEYSSIISQQIALSRHATYGNYHPRPAPFVRTYNSMVSGSSMPQRQRYPTLSNLQRNQNHSQMMMGNTTFSVPRRTSVSRFTAAQLPGSAETTSSGSRFLTTRIPRHSWLSRSQRSSHVQLHTASSSDSASSSMNQSGYDIMSLLNKSKPAREVTSPPIREGGWMEKLQNQLMSANRRLELSKMREESPVLGRRSRQTELGESSSGFKRLKNNQGPSPQQAVEKTENEDRGKNTISSPTRVLVNGVYDPCFDRAGLAVDPHLRMFRISQYNVRDVSSDESYPRLSD
ncbi:hypothetical protein L6164_016109 [Bauhinia variegata]|uniref:Uncharacterized protein n=1 Tax=Bauhinia variegata TaxID=167791 RepID=A0ACB9NNR8_BAUVA|nr:hypothetical protein L6164_016109 [Bauhinia variegata]